MFLKRINWSAFRFKVNNFTVEFATDIVEEILFNITAVEAANAYGIVKLDDLKLIVKPKMVPGFYILNLSKTIKNQMFRVISGATPNLLM